MSKESIKRVRFYVDIPIPSKINEALQEHNDAGAVFAFIEEQQERLKRIGGLDVVKQYELHFDANTEETTT